MEYMQNTDSIFAVCCQFHKGMQDEGNVKKHQARCAIYSFESASWKDLPSIAYQFDAYGFSCKTFVGNDAVYLQQNLQGVASKEFSKLSLKQGQWIKTGITLPFDDTFDENWKAWIENGCMMRAIQIQPRTVKIFSLDLRNNKKRWKRERVEIKGLEQREERLYYMQ